MDRSTSLASRFTPRPPRPRPSRRRPSRRRPVAAVLGSVVAAVIALGAPAGAATTWSVTAVTPQPPFSLASEISGMSCPSPSLCVAVTQNGEVLVSANPTAAGSWSVSHVDGNNAFLAISCPTTALCVATDDRDNVVTSTDPGAGGAVWGVTQAGFVGVSISCPTMTLCVAGADNGSLYTSSNPGGGPAAWSGVDADRTIGIVSISCPSVSLCVAGDEDGNVLVSSQPADGQWRLTNIDETDPIIGMSCRGSHHCVGTDLNGGRADFDRSELRYMGDHASGRSRWRGRPAVLSVLSRDLVLRGR